MDEAPAESVASGATRRIERIEPITVLAIIALALATLAGWLYQFRSIWGRLGLAQTDLGIFRLAGRAVLDGVPLYSMRFPDVGGWTWPPFGALVMVPLTWVPEPVLLPLAYAVNAVLLAAVLWLCSGALRSRFPSAGAQVVLIVALAVLAVGTTPVADTLGLGQVGLVLLLLCTLDLVVIARRTPRATGVLIGISTAVKITPALFIVHFLMNRQWRAAITATATVIVCWSAAALLLWQDTYTYWSQGLLLKVNERIDDFGSWVYNQSWMGFVDGLPRPWPTLLWLVLSAATLGLGLRAAARAHRAGDPVLVLGLVGLTSVLVSPISWHHHAVWVVPALLAVLGDARTRWRCITAGVVAVLLMIPSRVQTGVPDIFVVLYAVLMVAMIALPHARRSADQGAAQQVAAAAA